MAEVTQRGGQRNAGSGGTVAAPWDMGMEVGDGYGIYKIFFGYMIYQLWIYILYGSSMDISLVILWKLIHNI